MYTHNTDTGIVTLDSSGEQVAPSASPTDAAFVAYNEWVLAGNTPTQYTPPHTSNPPPVTQSQMRLALEQLNLLTAVQTAVSSASQSVQTLWNFTSIFERHDPNVIALGAAVGQTPAQIDALFALAGSL